MHAFFVLALFTLALCSTATRVCAGRYEVVDDCDVLIAGGSTASLAAAWAAAEANRSMVVCLLEITDWLGGQLTSNAVSAIDYGVYNAPDKHMANLPLPFQMLSAMYNDASGACWVSERCYRPADLLEKFINPHTAAHTAQNLRVYLNTAVVATEVDAEHRLVSSVTAVRRIPVNGTKGYEAPLSEALPDWYSPENSSLFSKRVLSFTGFRAVVDATEFGDVLMTAQAPVSQGMEYPEEDSDNTYDTCGQSNTFDFYMSYNKFANASAAWQPPRGCTPCSVTRGTDDEFSAANEEKAKDEVEGTANTDGHQDEKCCHYYVQVSTAPDWNHVWTYRRSFCNGSRAFDSLNSGDISLQNWGAQDSPYYLFLPVEDAREQVRAGKWAGGVNLTALRLSEDRAYGWYWFFKDNNTQSSEHLSMMQFEGGTSHGLAKLPYLRDTRRSARGLGGFRMLQSQLAIAERFDDTIAIGYYNVDTHLGHCANPLPPYMQNTTIRPYYIPFRALTVESVGNLLVAGKTMSQSLHANSATRLHPEEWATGMSAGVAAVTMAERGCSTSDVLDNIAALQARLKAAGQPLEWTL